ncbi:MAG TPA: amidohydrolase family protein [Terriglobia bacterium]|nr:amidohydrolase family protein [Terriglobia bacterium]
MIRRIFPVLLVTATTFCPALGQDKLAIVNVTIIDATDHPPRAHSTVIVQGDKIAAITRASDRPPKGAKVIDGTGKFLIPGLWNNDLHGPAYGDAKEALLSLVSYGVTTVRDMGAPLDDIVRLRAATASGELTGPRLFIAGPLMEGPVPVQMGLIVDLFSEMQARDEMRILEEHHVDYVEIDTSLTPELYSAIADEARRRHLPLVGHIPATVSAWDIVKAGQADVEHLGGRYLNVLVSCSSDEAYFNRVIGQTYNDLLTALKEKRPATELQFKADFDERLLSSFDEGKAQRLFDLYAKSGVAQTPTLDVLKTLWETNKDDHKLNERDVEFGRKIFAKDLEVVGQMRRAGVPILAGTDGPYPQGGETLHSELELLVEAGLIPLQALQAATRDAAAAMAVSKELGTVQVGKTADLVLLDADPLKDISNTRKINAVILRGRLFSKHELASMRGR